jgi:hypothetical protein
MPVYGESFDVFRLGQDAFPVMALDGGAHAEIAHGQHVGPAQREDQKHMRGPYADALDVGERGDDFFVAHLGQPREVHFAALRVLGQITLRFRAIPAISR